MQTSVKIFDTTLRDGTQGEGSPYPLKIKLKLLRSWMSLGFIILKVDGRAATAKISNFLSALNMNLKMPRLQHSEARDAKIHVAADEINLNRLWNPVQVATIFGKSWDFHVQRPCKLHWKKI